MKNSTLEAKVVAYKIARDLDGTSPVVGLKALMMFLVALVCHSKNPKRLADYIIGGLKRAVENAEGVLHIADNFSNRKQSESSKINTFIHEVVHGVLDTMGEFELTKNGYRV